MLLHNPTPAPLPKIKLSRLRDIGWSIWDPIGLLDEGQRWDDEECQHFADEYDTYLLQAAGRLRRGEPDHAVVEYLAQMEAEQMGLGVREGVYSRAELVVAAIQADKELWNYSS